MHSMASHCRDNKVRPKTYLQSTARFSTHTGVSRQATVLVSIVRGTRFLDENVVLTIDTMKLFWLLKIFTQCNLKAQVGYTDTTMLLFIVVVVLIAVG